MDVTNEDQRFYLKPKNTQFVTERLKLQINPSVSNTHVSCTVATPVCMHTCLYIVKIKHILFCVDLYSVSKTS